MLKQTLAFGAMLLSTSIFAETSYICVADFGAILKFDKKSKSWSGGGVASPNKKYIISKPDKSGSDKDYAWTVKEIGDAIPIAYCRDDFRKDGKLYCPSFYDMQFNKENGRFLLIYPIGYWSDNLDAKEGESLSQGADMPHMLAGKCSPL